MNVHVLAVDHRRGTVDVVCCDRVLSAQWDGATPRVGPTIIEADIPATTWTTLLDERGDGIPAVVIDYDADGTVQLALLDGAPVLLEATDEPPLGIVGRRVVVPTAGWTLYPVNY